MDKCDTIIDSGQLEWCVTHGQDVADCRLSRISELEKEKATMYENQQTLVRANTGLKAQIAELEAREQRLREALKWIAQHSMDGCGATAKAALGDGE